MASFSFPEYVGGHVIPITGAIIVRPADKGTREVAVINDIIDRFIAQKYAAAGVMPIICAYDPATGKLGEATEDPILAGPDYLFIETAPIHDSLLATLATKSRVFFLATDKPPADFTNKNFNGGGIIHHPNYTAADLVGGAPPTPPAPGQPLGNSDGGVGGAPPTWLRSISAYRLRVARYEMDVRNHWPLSYYVAYLDATDEERDEAVSGRAEIKMPPSERLRHHNQDIIKALVEDIAAAPIQEVMIKMADTGVCAVRFACVRSAKGADFAENKAIPTADAIFEPRNPEDRPHIVAFIRDENHYGQIGVFLYCTETGRRSGYADSKLLEIVANWRETSPGSTPAFSLPATSFCGIRLPDTRFR